MFQFKTIVILLMTELYVGSFVDAELVYKASFMENVESCPDFDNKILDALPLLMASEGLGLEGSIETLDDIPDGSKVSLEIYKETDHGLEYLGQLASDFCASLDEQDVPWRPVVEAMKLSGCPMPIKTFMIEKLDIDLSFAKDVMCHEYVGTYIVKIIIEDNSKPPEIIVCYQVQVAIIEEEEE